MTESLTIRLHRAGSWIKRADDVQHPDDLDERFIFYWIAFGALYGQPAYLFEKPNEFQDIREFLKLMEESDSNHVIRKTLTGLTGPAQKLLENKFLNRDCWITWDKQRIRDVMQREQACHGTEATHPSLKVIFSRLYVLRNQIFHGCATNKGRRNRESLEAAVPVLRACLRTFREICRQVAAGHPRLEQLPYPPSSGARMGFNRPRVNPRTV